MTQVFVRIDDSCLLPSPPWMERRMHPKLADTGPLEYYLSSVVLRRPSNQSHGRPMSGASLYEQIKEERLLPICLGLRDLLAIRCFGVSVYRRYFPDGRIYGWKDVGKHEGINRLSVPYLAEESGSIALGWQSIGKEDYLAASVACFSDLVQR